MKRLTDTSTLEEDIIAGIEILELRARDVERAVRKSNARIDKLRAMYPEIQAKLDAAIKNLEDKLDVINRDI